YHTTVPMLGSGVVPMATGIASWGGAGSSGGSSGNSQSVGRESTKDSSSAPAASIGAPGDYSQTNIQVAGVDEPDIVKNDARYIYVISGSTLAIVDAYPAASASVISKTDIADSARDLFVAGDRLVLFTVGWDGAEDSDVGTGSPMTAKGMPRIRTMQTTHALVYDIGDRTKPKLLKDYTIEGDYIDARMIGSLVYMVSREQIYPYYDEPIIVPTLREGSRTIVQPDVWYFDNYELQYAFTTITALDIATGNEKDAQTYLLGTGNIMYVSPDAMYVSYQKYRPVYYPMRGTGIAAPQPIGWGLEVATAVGSAVKSSAGEMGISPSQASSGVSSTPIRTDFNTMTEEQRQSIIDDLKGAEQEVIQKEEFDQTTTVIHKIAIKDGTFAYVAKGEVPGTLKNQFSMDEYSDNLRVATTSTVSTRAGQYTYSNVYVLNGQMDTIGMLTHIAEQESIYSTRFIGDRLYMVTFRRIDPFFVIDLSTPESPKILGKLKVPGFSDYLHPYDATHIIGIGKETASNDWGGVSVSGVKMALFDVSDVANPKQIDKVQIGDAGSDSPALTDHHAFLFDREKDLLVIPVRAVSAGHVRDGDHYNYQQQVWHGAYVFSLTPESGFTLRGTVQHGSEGDGYYYYGSSSSEVKRSLYIGEVLYTISGKQIKANSLGNINTTISTIPLPEFGDIYYPEPDVVGI
ncbi:MAG: beta-propeller domain-containing protein, partial [Methanoregulaceae archaeon]|nr:beta-propeller domain-containing protein [Methanoregulaceae archaeon]